METNYIFLILLIIFSYLCYKSYNIHDKENFKIVDKVIKIPDRSNILPDSEGNTLAVFKNVKKYKNLELQDKVVKAIVFNKSEMKLTNLENIREFTLTFNIKFKNTTDLQIIISSLDVNKSLLWSLYISNNKLFLKFKKKQRKFNIRMNKNNIYYIIINFSNDYINVYLDGEIKKIESKDEYEFNNNIIIGGLNRGTKLISPLKNCLVGNINLYKQIIDPLKLAGDFSTCEFIPGGSTKQRCIAKCNSISNCDSTYCSKVCNECIDYRKCKWVPEPTKKPVGITPSPTIADPPKIKCFAGDGEIYVKFKIPGKLTNDTFEYSGNIPIKSFLIVVKKSYNPGGFVKLLHLEEKKCSYDRGCQYKVTDLENNVLYDVMVKSINSIGISDFSNVETIAPNGPIKMKQISSALIESDDEIKDVVNKKFNKDNLGCSAKNFINHDNHILNKVSNYDIKDVIHEEYLVKK